MAHLSRLGPCGDSQRVVFPARWDPMGRFGQNVARFARKPPRTFVHRGPKPAIGQPAVRQAAGSSVSLPVVRRAARSACALAASASG